MKAKIRGKVWSILRRRISPKLRGDCNIETREIRISSSLNGEEELEVTLHETLHAAFWDLDEHAVEAAATDAAAILWKMGWRKQTKP